jgi:HSP20 family molecular chaperone IbpA
MSDNAMTKNEGRAIARPEPVQRRADRPLVVPACDVFESADEVLVVADMPGVTRDALEINLANGELTVTARRDAQPGRGTVVGTEYRTCDFQRRFVIPGGIDAERIQAELKNGVLLLHLPKSEALKPRRIAVSAG